MTWSKSMPRVVLLLSLVFVQIQTAWAQWDIVRIDEGAKPALALGANCTAEISYMLENNDGYVRHAQILPGGLPVISPVDEGYFYGPLDVATSSAGNVFISYHDHDVEDQMVAVRTGGNWTIEQVSNPGHDGWDNNILVTDDGIVHTSSVDPSGFGGRGVEYARRSATGFWTVEGAATPSIMYANATSIVIGSNGEPAIAYYNDTAADLELAERSGGLWTTSLVDSAGLTGRFPSMVLDDTGNLHIVYYKVVRVRTGTVMYAEQNGDAWTVSVVDTLENVQIGFTGARRNVALAIDGNGERHIVYGDRSVIKYAKGTPGDWTFETVVDKPGTDSELGQQVDMSICNSDGLLHMVYYETEDITSPWEIWYARQLISVGLEDSPDVAIAQIQVYPNPAINTVKIQIEGNFTGTRGPATLSIFDALGRKVFVRNMTLSTSSNTFTLNDLAPGVYLVQLETATKKQESSFIISR